MNPNGRWSALALPLVLWAMPPVAAAAQRGSGPERRAESGVKAQTLLGAAGAAQIPALLSTPLTSGVLPGPQPAQGTAAAPTTPAAPAIAATPAIAAVPAPASGIPRAASSPTAGLSAALPGQPASAFDAVADPGSANRPAEERPLPQRIWNEARRLGFAQRGSAEVDMPIGGAETPAPTLPPSSARERPAQAEPRPAPPSKTADDSARRGFFASLLVSQIGVEILGLLVPQLANSLTTSLSDVALLPAVSFAALTLGSVLGGPLVDRWGIRKVYLGGLMLRTAAGSLMALALSTSHLALPALIGLFGLDFMFLGASRVAEAVTPTVLYGSAQGKVQGFGTIQQMVIEGMGVVGLAIGGILLATSGFAAALWAYPVLVLLSAAITYRFLPLPAVKAAVSVPLKQQALTAAAALRALPILRRAAVGYGLNVVLTAWVYFSITPNLGLFASRSGMASTSATLLGTLVYASGGFLATLLMRRRDLRLAREFGALDGRRPLLRSSARWLSVGAVALLGAASLAFASTMSGFAVSLVFLFAWGLTASGLFVHLESFIKTEAPESARGSILGLVRGSALLIAAASFPALGWIFGRFSESTASGTPLPTAGSFIAVAAALGAAAAAYSWVAHGLRRAATTR